MRETAAAKARRYLSEGRVILTRVGPDRVDAFVRGDAAVHASGYRNGEWRCTCPARTDACSHLRSLKLITAVDLPRGAPWETAETHLPAHNQPLPTETR